MPSSIDLKQEEALCLEHLQALYDEMKQRAENAERKYDEEKKLRMRMEHKLRAQIMFVGDEHDKLLDLLDTAKSEVRACKTKLEKQEHKREKAETRQENEMKLMNGLLKDETTKRVRAEAEREDARWAPYTIPDREFQIMKTVANRCSSQSSLLKELKDQRTEMRAMEERHKRELVEMQAGNNRMSERAYNSEYIVKTLRDDPKYANNYLLQHSTGIPKYWFV